MKKSVPSLNKITSKSKKEFEEKMFGLMREIYPLCRSITGNGVRKTLKILQGEIPIQIKEVPTGTEVFDWTIPKEWNLKDAFIKNSKGQKIIDFRESNLHVLNYSAPVRKWVSFDELKNHLFTLPEHPDWIPYRTSYYNENWGFCISHKQFLELKEDNYEVFIDASLDDGYLTYGEYYIEGAKSDEVLISTHICHPSMANDNCSGIVLTTYLAKNLSRLPRKYSYRFLFIPGTIGSITWLFLNERNVSKIKYGLVAACVGDPGKFSYKKTRRQEADINQIVAQVFKDSEVDFRIIEFFPYGYDERQYCSPGFDLPVGCLMRTPHGQFPEYHSSADNLAFVTPEALFDTFLIYNEVMNIIEQNKTYLTKNPKCEPQLGKRGLYSLIEKHADRQKFQLALFWVLNLSDGRNSLLEIAKRSGFKFALIKESADALMEHGLLDEKEESSS